MSDSIFFLEKRDDGIAILWMDDPNDKINTLKREMLDEINQHLDRIESSNINVLVFASAKSDNFLAGANLDMLKAVTTADDARKLSEIAQQLTARIERLDTTTVAAINGSCFGGGLELALAFDGRVAADTDKTRIGLPEVKLGVIPAGGGTQRLPRLIGLERSLDMMLTGRSLRPRHALSWGVIDDVVHPDILIQSAIKLGQSSFSQINNNRRPGIINRSRNWLLAGNPIGRNFVFDRASKQARRKTRGNYPAPNLIINAIKVGLNQGKQQGYRAEAHAFGELVVSPQSRQLINVFFATTELKKHSGIKDSDVKPVDINKIGVLGAGLMGAGIAYVSINQTATQTRIKDRDSNGVGCGLAYVRKLIDGRVQKRALTRLQGTQVMNRLTGTVDYSGFQHCELVIEAVFENLELKQQMLRDVELECDDQTIFASNTSALPIHQIATASRHPETVIGMHYFSPVEKMPLLEVITTDQTADWVTETCVDLGRRQGKIVIVVNDGPGFYTTRILGPYMNEAAHMLSEGVPIEHIDKALKDYGFPVGPMALLDEVGIDVGFHVADTLHQAFGERMTPPAGLKKLMDDQRLGRKNKKGLYRYTDNKNKTARQPDESVYRLLNIEADNILDAGTVAERCALQMINEAAYCLGEGILNNPRDGDVGAIFGLGFPPFLGGPFRAIDEQGVDRIIEKLEKYQQTYGLRFSPAPLLKKMVQDKAQFY